MFNFLLILSIPDNDLEQNLNKGIGALWENLEGCKASWQEENFEQKLPEDRACPAESDRAAIREKRGTRSMSLKPLHLNRIEKENPEHGHGPSIKDHGLFVQWSAKSYLGWVGLGGTLAQRCIATLLKVF